MLIKRKKSQSIAINLLVIMTMFVCGTALLTFWNSDTKQAKQVLISPAIQEFLAENENFKDSIYYIAEDTLAIMLKHQAPDKIMADDFVNRFRINYGIYSKTNDFPDDFKSAKILEQIRNLSKYDVKSNQGIISVKLNSLEFSKNYDASKYAGIQNLSLSNEISFELNATKIAIALKTPTP